jgi:hypothetical protein
MFKKCLKIVILNDVIFKSNVSWSKSIKVSESKTSQN